MKYILAAIAAMTLTTSALSSPEDHIRAFVNAAAAKQVCHIEIPNSIITEVRLFARRHDVDEFAFAKTIGEMATAMAIKMDVYQISGLCKHITDAYRRHGLR